MMHMTTQVTPTSQLPTSPESLTSTADCWDKSKAMGLDIPFLNLLDFDLAMFEDGFSELLCLPKPEHRNSFDITHGGV
jgi:acyl-coenzyme A thioesterase PaaI-like protein